MTNDKMTPAKYVKSRGVHSLADMAEALEVRRGTLELWFREHPVMFDSLVRGYLYHRDVAELGEVAEKAYDIKGQSLKKLIRETLQEYYDEKSDEFHL